jgi:hypothetical protein
MNFLEQTNKIESKINCLDGRTKEAKLFKKQLTILWQNASEKNLSDHALISIITDTPVMEFFKGNSIHFQEIFRRYVTKLKITRKIKAYYSSK